MKRGCFILASSARKLNGDELLRVGESPRCAEPLSEALTYYEQALEFFRATKQRQGEATALTKIGLISNGGPEKLQPLSFVMP